MNNGKGPSTQKRVLLFISHKSRSGQEASQKVEELLKERGHIIVNDTQDQDTDPNKVISNSSEIDAVIVGGGDGSVNFILPSLIKEKFPLLVIPLGTANNLARSMELPYEFDKSLDLLEQNNTVEIDLGIVNDIPFVNVVGLGLSTEINRKTPSTLKKFLGVFAFIATGIRLLFSMNPFRVEISTDKGETIHAKSWQISVCNGKHYGAGMVIKHDATLDDEKLHLLSTEGKYWWKNLSLIPSVITGRYKREQEITLLAAKEITLKTKRKLKIDVDGDIKTETPANLKVLPKSLRLFTKTISDRM